MEEISRWFDENGNEIIREPVDIEQTEFIAEIGGELEESSVGINFYSFELDKQLITNLLGVEPTKAWNPNEMHKIGNGKKSRMTNWGKWYLNTSRDNTDINKKLEKLLNGLTSNLDHWNELTNKYEAWVDVAGYMNNWNRGFKLSSKNMKLLSDRNLEVVFDIYYEEDETE